jgi:acyl-CoA synthetase (AMP-forming)/AMP-acid ligase II
VGKGMHVGVLIDGQANLEGQVALYALARLGAVLVPLNPRYLADELAYAIAHSDCAAVLASPPYVERVEALAYRLPGLKLRIAFIGPAPSGWIALPEVNAAPLAAWPEVRRGDLLNIIFTSGTTARPKGVMHSHATALACGAIFATALGLTPEDRMHHATPFFTSSGSHIGPMMQLWSGEAVIIEAAFKPAEQLQRLSRLRSTILGGVPAQLLFLLEERERMPDIDMSSVRLVDYGGSPTPVEIVRAIDKRFAPAGQVQQWGMTEIGIATLLPAKDAMRKIGSCGKATVFNEIKIVDDAGRALPPGELGEICSRGPANMLGYYKDAKATAATMQDGWVRTGDIGIIDADGYIFYSDRIKDIVNRGGLKISSIEVEEVLFQHPDVREAAVIAIPHPKLGEDVAAFVSAKEGRSIDTEALIAFTRGKLADYKCPRKVFVVDLLPRNGMGKVAKNELRGRVKT